MKKFSSVFALLGGLALASTVLTGCSSSSSTTTTTSQTTTSYIQYLFNVNNGVSPSTVSSFLEHSDTGGLSPTQTPTVAAGNGGDSIKVNPAGQYAYVNNSLDSTVSQYAISSLGSLAAITTPISCAGANGSGTPTGGCIHPNGLFYYTANASDISVFSIGSGGALTFCSNTSASAVGSPEQLAFDATGTYLYVSGATTATNTGGVYAFTVSPTTGALTPLSLGTTGLNYINESMPVGGLVVDNASHLYASAGTNTILGFTIGTGGMLTPLNNMPVLPTGSFNGVPAGLAFNASHAALFVAEPAATNGVITGFVGAYAVTASSGALAAAINQPFAAAANIYNVATDPTGSYLYSTLWGENEIGAYVIGSGGTLSPISAYSTGAGPISLALVQYITYGAAQP